MIYFERMYFGTTNGDLFTEMEIINAAYITEKKEFTSSEELREWALNCPGITKEIKHPSTRYLIKAGHVGKAVRVYWENKRKRDPNFRLSEARDAVDNIRLAMIKAGEI